MKNYVFPLLKAEDIEIRIGQMNKEKNKAVLLLYKTARTDSKYLDQILGADNWQCKFYECKGYLFCSVGIYLDDRKEWIWKDDAGAPSDIETDKGHASDAFKRACYKLGLGKELYTSPEIKWIDVKDKYDKFYVKEVGYNEKDRQITTLVVCREDDDSVCFEYRNGKRLYTQPRKETNVERPYVAPTTNSIQDTNNVKGTLHTAQKENIEKFFGELDEVNRKKWFAYMENHFNTMSIESLSVNQADALLKLIQQFRKKGN